MGVVLFALASLGLFAWSSATPMCCWQAGQITGIVNSMSHLPVQAARILSVVVHACWRVLPQPWQKQTRWLLPESCPLPSPWHP